MKKSNISTIVVERNQNVEEDKKGKGKGREEIIEQSTSNSKENIQNQEPRTKNQEESSISWEEYTASLNVYNQKLDSGSKKLKEYLNLNENDSENNSKLLKSTSSSSSENSKSILINNKGESKNEQIDHEISLDERLQRVRDLSENIARNNAKMNMNKKSESENLSTSSSIEKEKDIKPNPKENEIKSEDSSFSETKSESDYSSDSESSIDTDSFTTELAKTRSYRKGDINEGKGENIENIKEVEDGNKSEQLAKLGEKVKKTNEKIDPSNMDNIAKKEKEVLEEIEVSIKQIKEMKIDAEKKLPELILNITKAINEYKEVVETFFSYLNTLSYSAWIGGIITAGYIGYELCFGSIGRVVRNMPFVLNIIDSIGGGKYSKYIKPLATATSLLASVTPSSSNNQTSFKENEKLVTATNTATNTTTNTTTNNYYSTQPLNSPAPETLNIVMPKNDLDVRIPFHSNPSTVTPNPSAKTGIEIQNQNSESESLLDKKLLYGVTIKEVLVNVAGAAATVLYTKFKPLKAFFK